MRPALGDSLRSILAQYNEQFGSSNNWRAWGPHYVTYEQGVFMMYPFGSFEDDRYSFEVRRDFSEEEEELWIFYVLPW